MNTVLNDLKELATAEEFLTFLEVPFDPHVVAVNRLHILKRFHDYSHQDGLPGVGSEEDVKSAYARALRRAYADFVESDARSQKVFKVFHTAPARRTFVPLASVTRKS